MALTITSSMSAPEAIKCLRAAMEEAPRWCGNPHQLEILVNETEKVLKMFKESIEENERLLNLMYGTVADLERAKGSIESAIGALEV